MDRVSAPKPMDTNRGPFESFLRSGALWAIIIVLTALTLTVAVVRDYWCWLNGGTETPSTTVRNIGLLLGGLVAIGLAIWRGAIAESQAASAQRQTETTRLSLLNDRYQKGAEMLGSPILSVRMAGVYALQRLAEDYPSVYHVQTAALLCAFARNPPHVHTVDSSSSPGSTVPDDDYVREDVQAALTAIGQRKGERISLEKDADFRLDLRGCKLATADITGLDLSGADLTGTKLRSVRGRGANLSSTTLWGVDLRDAQLADANLQDAQIYDSDLTEVSAFRANFSRAGILSNLRDADLSDARFVDAQITRSDMQGATMLRADLTGVRFGTSLAAIFREHPEPQDLFAQITQSQLDQATADSDNPPQFAAGMTDIITGKPLVWRGAKRQES